MLSLAGTWLVTDLKGRQSKSVRCIELVGEEESDEQLKIQEKNSWL